MGQAKGTAAPFDLEEAKQLPNYYVDYTHFGFGAYGFTLLFGKYQFDGSVKSHVMVSMSPQHAFVVCQLLRKNLRQYIQECGQISLPEGIIEELGIDRVL